MSRNTLEKILLCELEPVEIGYKILPGLICKAEKTTTYGGIIRQNDIKFAYYPSEYYGELYGEKNVPYITALEISGKFKKSRNRLEIAIYETKEGLELKRSEIIKERNNKIVDRKEIMIEKETLKDINYVSKSLMNYFCDYLLNNRKSEKIVFYLLKINDIVKDILRGYVNNNFDKPFNEIDRYPSFYGRIRLFAPDPEILGLMDLYRK